MGDPVFAVHVPRGERRPAPARRFPAGIVHGVRLVVAALLALTFGPATAGAALSTLSSEGGPPSAVTDRDGVTHVVWNETVDGSDDRLVYCRILRGELGCDGGKRVLAVTCEGGAPARRGYLTTNEMRPRVHVTPFGEVIVTTHGICAWDWGTDALPWRQLRAHDRQFVLRSNDSGATFEAPQPGPLLAQGYRGSAGEQPSEGGSFAATVYDSADSRVVSVESSPYRNSSLPKPGIYVVGGQETTDTAARLRSRLATEPLAGAPLLVQRGRGAFTTVYRTQAGAFIRTFDCGGCALSALWEAQQWSPAQPIAPETRPDEQSIRLVSGPAGTFLMYRTNENDSASDRYWIHRVDGTTLGPRRQVTPPSNRYVGVGDLTQDQATGRLFATVLVDGGDSTLPDTYRVTVSDDAGVTWSPLIDVTEQAPNSPARDAPVVSLSTGDAGFTGLMFVKDANVPYANYGPIYVTALPGSGQSPGGGPDPTPSPSPAPSPDPAATPGPSPGASPGSDPGTDPGNGTPPGPDLPSVPGVPSIPGLPSVPGVPPLPSLPPLPPAPKNEACKVRQFGPLDIRGDACLAVDPKTGVISARGTVSVNGMSVAATEMRFDPKLRTVRSIGPATFAIGDAKLFRIPVDWKLPAGNVFSLPGLDLGGLGGVLKGFPLNGSADVTFVRGGVEIPVHLGLPKVFGGITGDVTLRADNLAGLHLRELKVKAGLIPLGPGAIRNLEFLFNPDEDRWSGGALLELPPGLGLDARVAFSKGDLEYLKNELTFPGQGIPLDGLNITHLTRVRFSLSTQPDLVLSGGVTFTAGPRFQSYSLAEIDGDLTLRIPDRGPFTLRADGRLELMTIPVANAYAQARSDGLVSFGGSVHFDGGSVVQVDGRVDGWIVPPKAFSVEGRASVCAFDFACANGTVLVSTIGFAACVNGFGGGYEWGPSVAWAPAFLLDLDPMFGNCSVADYRPATPAGAGARATRSATGGRATRAQVAGARTVSVKSGLPFAVFAAEGTTAPPHVVLVAPDGTRIDAPATQVVERDGVKVGHLAQRRTTYVVVTRPAAGSWTVEPQADSSPLASVGHGDGLPEPKVRAKVLKGRAGRTLRYDITPLPGQKVRFVEEGAPGSAAAVLGNARRDQGELRFTPASGPGGRRTIVAEVESFGKPRTRIPVATYTAPAPTRPAKPKGLTVKQAGSVLKVAWHAVPRVKRYRLRVELGDGRVALLLPKGGARTATVPSVGRKVRATVRLQGERADGTPGAAATTRLKG